MNTSPTTNLSNRIKKLYVPTTKSLLPLFEVISNAIHAIYERQEKNNEKEHKGEIIINLIRNGSHTALQQLDDIDKYPIKAFEVIDNGIGMDDENMKSFMECDTDKKASIGGKGVGRLVCIKLFSEFIVESIYKKDNELFSRSFLCNKKGNIIHNYNDNKILEKKDTGTKIILSGFEEKYQKKSPKDIVEISRQIITHFQLYFIERKMPPIKVINQNNTHIDLNALFDKEFEADILDDIFVIGENEFKVYITKSFNAQSHKILYCAHERAVRDEGISKYIEDLRLGIQDDDGKKYYYQVFVLGKFLDDNVNEERTNFHFSDEEDENEELTLAKIRKVVLEKIEILLEKVLSKIRKDKMDKYLPIIQKEFPNYSSVINYNREKVNKIPRGLTNQELDVHLYKIESEWKIDVKRKAIELLDKKKDITNLDDYNSFYEDFLSEFNDIGKTELARYVVHRRAVIDLLEKLIEIKDDDKFYDENIIHSLFFPIREYKKNVPNEKQNLWLLDERLTFNTLLASDKTFNQINDINSKSSDRVDLIIKQEEVFNKATLFSEEKYPYESFTIVEFKKPYRNDYKYGDEKKDPIEQVRKYIDEIIDGKIKNKGRKIEASKSTPFYCYIIADITDSLEKILKRHEFTTMPDGMGYFRFYVAEALEYKAYIEVLPFQKVIKNAKERNKILFDKLNIF